MAGFDKFDQPLRYYAEVNVPGFDMAKSIAKANKKKQKQRSQQTVAAPAPPPKPDPAPKKKGAGTKPAQKGETCPLFPSED